MRGVADGDVCDCMMESVLVAFLFDSRALSRKDKRSLNEKCAEVTGGLPLRSSLTTGIYLSSTVPRSVH